MPDVRNVPANEEDNAIDRRHFLRQIAVTSSISAASTFGILKCINVLAQKGPKQWHEKMREVIYERVLEYGESPGFLSAHPKGASDECPSNPLIVIPFHSREASEGSAVSAQQNRHETEVAAMVANLYEHADLRQIYVDSVPAEKRISIDRRMIADDPARRLHGIVSLPESYAKFIQTTEGRDGGMFDLPEAIALLMPELVVRGARVMGHSIPQSILGYNASVCREYAPLQKAYHDAREADDKFPLCQLVKNGDEIRVKIGEREFDDPVALQRVTNAWFGLCVELESAKKWKNENVVKNVDEVLLADPETVYALQYLAPENGRSLFTVHWRTMNHRKMIPVPPMQYIEEAIDLLSELRTICREAAEDRERSSPRNHHKIPQPPPVKNPWDYKKTVFV